MLLLVGCLIEGLRAAVDWTYVRLLPRMNAEVVEQIVPFPEYFAAVREITGEYVRGAAGQRVEKLDMAKLSG